MWLVVSYQPVSLFSLKASLATGSGAKSLLVPTPFAIRTALLDVCIRTEGLEAGRAAFPWIKALRIAIRPPQRAVVTHLFTKVLKPTRQEATDDAAVARAFDRTIAFREYVHHDGLLGLAFEPPNRDVLDRLARLVGGINYLGKRGSLVQWVPPTTETEALPSEFLRIGGEEFDLPPSGVVQQVDDWGPSLTFEKLNIFSPERIALHRDRVLMPVRLPYRMVRSSKGFAFYEAQHSP